MKYKRASWVAAAAIACGAFLAAACGGDGGGPTGLSGPGQLTVNISTTGSGGGAFLMTVTGSGITNPVAASSGDLFYSFASGNTLRVIVIGSHSSGPLFRISVPNVGQVSSYSVTLNEVAGSDNALQSTGSYTLTVAN
jgi:hypothetical protein